MQVAGVSNGAVNGARAAYERHPPQIQEDYPHGKSVSNSNAWSNSGPREPFTNGANRNATTKDTLQPGYPTYSRVEELGKQELGMSRSGSEADSLLDLYRRNNSNSNSNVDINSLDHDIPENMYRPETDDPEGWIHRDKLAKIENEELQAAGINLANARRTTSKTGRRQQSRDGTTEDAREQTARAAREEKRQRISSPVAEEEEEAERTNWDLRSPEEIAADTTAAATSPVFSNSVTRKTGSKIPVLASSPMPIPQERVERDTLLPRKRTMSGSITPEETPSGMRIRPRQNSEGVLNDIDANGTPSASSRVVSKTSSPTKMRSPSAPINSTSTTASSAGTNNTPASRKTTSNVRKASASAQRITATATSPPASPPRRPGTRSGDLDRPRTAVNRPEGDPPWLATMYKPDPRLPPDEQIIPTHARRAQQAVWEEEGAVPNTYDRDFSPLMVHPVSEQPRPQPQTAPELKRPEPVLEKEREREKERDENAWPLKPMPSVRSNNSTGRPGTSGSLTGGYSTMPKVTSLPVSVGPGSPRVSQGQGAPVRLRERRPEDLDVEGEKVEKGCGCCVVM